jgi:lipoprotein-anchoring transpeptidase ErfK/SrfK
MHSLYKIKWSIFVGVVLLVIAFFILFTSQNKTVSNAGNTSADEVSSEISQTFEETTIKTSILEETTPEETMEKTTEETTTENNPENLINFDAEYPYLIRVNRAENFAVVYGMDKNGQHSIPYKIFICSTGLNEDDTPLGIFEISEKYRWRLMVDGTYAQYAVRIYGQIMLHSVPYTSPTNDSLEYWEYNKLGQAASLGCIRFRVAAIKWIYDNCKEGTKVNVYSESGEVPPLSLPKIKKIKKSNLNSGWDPTDPDAENPWKQTKKKNKE